MALTPEQVQIIKSTVPILAEHGVTITTLFYKNMLDAHPELNNVFNRTHQVSGHQPRALATAVYAYAANIDDLGKLSPAVELICHKHASLYIRPDQYAIVGKYLLEAMGLILGAALTPDILAAWAAAYQQLADLMIAREQQLYDSAHGWSDWRTFRIARRERESDEITSFYLEPASPSAAAAPLPTFKPGQYVGLRTSVPALSYLQARQYSLSDAPRAGHLRISVKREDGLDMAAPGAPAHPGYISNVLHADKRVGDTLELSHPFGDFFLDVDADARAGNDAPVVLVSGGVGLTCLLSIFNALAAEQPARRVSWIHGARSHAVRAFAPQVMDVARRNKNVRVALFTKEAGGEAVEGAEFHQAGRVDLDKLDKKDLYLDDARTVYYICGPTQMMLDIEAKLKGYGVPADRVFMELFGTGGVPRV